VFICQHGVIVVYCPLFCNKSNDVEQHIESLKPFLRRGARLAYVIGNSKFYNIVLSSDEILADVFEANGFQVVSTERMRRRNSKSGLYEAVVFMELHQ
jgi:hypothetical protein